MRYSLAARAIRTAAGLLTLATAAAVAQDKAPKANWELAEKFSRRTCARASIRAR